MDDATLNDTAVTLAPQERDLVVRAAAAQGVPVDVFVADALREAALRALEAAPVLALSERDSLTVANLIINPPTPNEAWRRAEALHDAITRRTP